MIEPVFNVQPQQHWLSIGTAILKYIDVPEEE